MALRHSTRVNWLIATGHFLAHFYVLCLPPLFIAWQAAFHVSFAELGLALALMSATTAVLQTPVGFLVDRHGARAFLVGGVVLMSAGIAAMGFATSYWQIVLFAVLSGAGNSVIHPADYAILSGSVEKERIGRAFALHTFAGNVGFSAAPPTMALLMVTVGWRTSVIAVGLIGVLAAGAILAQSGILKGQARKPAHAEAAVSGRKLLVSAPMLLFFGFYALGAMAGSGVQAWLITVLHRVHGVGLADASSALTGFTVGATVGVLLGGYFVDNFSGRLLSFTVVVSVASALLLLLVNALGMPVVLVIGTTFAAGLALGCTRTPRDMMLREAVPPGEMGKVFGFVSAGLPLGSALTPVPFGFLIDRGHPELILVLAAALLVLSLVCVAAARGAARRGAPAVAPAE
ncbi:MAG: MFS transporter [Rhodospirillales bacterium]|jgi:MFS family permease|nr:MFS transporter [Rhodospirillales bacterium]